MAKATRSKKNNPRGKPPASYAALRKRLEEQRLEILSMYEHDLKVGQTSDDDGGEDLVDRANNAYNREFMLSLSGSERQILLEIERALERFEDESYGTCVHCETKIQVKRLRAVPWARYCIDCQELVEQGLLLDD